MNWLAELFGVQEEHKHMTQGWPFGDVCGCGARLTMFGNWIER